MAKQVREGNLKKLDRNPKRKFFRKSNWIEGTWVRIDNRTHEHIVVALHGGPALRIRTVRPRPAAKRWSLKAIQEIVATPDQLNPKDTTEKIVRQERNTPGVALGTTPERSAEAADVTEAADAESSKTPREALAQLPRELRIIGAHLEKYGDIPDCLGCEAKRLGIPKLVHRRNCRLRIEAARRAPHQVGRIRR